MTMKTLLLLLTICCCNYLGAQSVLSEVPITGNNFAGYIGCLDAEPGNPNHILAAGGESGLWETRDGGTSWARMESLPAFRLITVAFCPTDPNFILVTSRRDSRLLPGSGIWLSTNKGSTWTEVTANCTGAWELSWMPGGNTAIVGTDNGLMVTNDKGITWLPQISNIGLGTTGIDADIISVKAMNNRTFFAAAASGLYKTTDAGATWITCRGVTPGGNVAHAICAVTNNLIFLTNYSNQLIYSNDGGLNFNPLPGSIPVSNMPPFVKCARTAFAANFTLYVSQGTNLFSIVLPFNNPSSWNWAAASILTLDHQDPQDVLFSPTTGAPVMLAGDFGIQLQNAGGGWVSVAGGRAGLNALELNGVAVQNFGSTAKDMYVTTWHNNVWTSTNGGRLWTAAVQYAEAKHIEASGPLLSDFSEAMFSTFSLPPGGPAYQAFGRGFTPPLNPRIPATLPAGDYYRFFSKGTIQYVLQVSSSGYQIAKLNDPGLQNFWTFNPTGPNDGLVDEPHVVYSAADDFIYIYQPVRVNNVNRLLRIRAREINGVMMLNPVDQRPLMAGINGLSTRNDGIKNRAMLAVKPDNPNLLLSVEAYSSQVMISIDGGDTWDAVQQVSDLIASNRLSLSPFIGTQVQVIKFNPYRPDDVYIGTIQSGVFNSTDGGRTWGRLDGSARVKWVNDFAFDLDGMVYVSSGATGLWKYNSRRLTRYPSFFVNDDRLLIVDPATGARVPIGDLGPDRCPACRLFVMGRGTINSFRFNENKIMEFGVSDPQSLYNYSLKDVDVTEDVLFRKENISFTKMNKPLMQSIPKGYLVKGVITNMQDIKAYILAPGDFAGIPYSMFKAKPGMPVDNHQILINGKAADLVGILKPDAGIIISGEGFISSSVLSIWFDDVLLTNNVTITTGGSFKAPVKIPAMAGRHNLTFIQGAGKNIQMTKVKAEVANYDKK